MVHKQEGADKSHNSELCVIQWDMSSDGHCGATPRYPAEQVPSSGDPTHRRPPTIIPAMAARAACPICREMTSTTWHLYFQSGPWKLLSVMLPLIWSWGGLLQGDLIIKWLISNQILITDAALHSLPLRARYGLSFVSSKFQCLAYVPAFAIIMSYVISCHLSVLQRNLTILGLLYTNLYHIC